ncbi:MAG: ABC transporter substrate-binding protein [Chloroflexia bacterium]|nr:ABC transporter substrate-binding protein [Chloroflexia bacterium]
MLGKDYARALRSVLAVFVLLVVPVLLSAAPLLAAQGSTPVSVDCSPAPRVPRDPPPAANNPEPVAAAELTAISVGVVPVSIFAPVFVALEKGYYAEQGLDVTLEPLPGGADLIALTASNQFQISAAGAGPAFWNAIALNLPITVIAPGHQESTPVATPLMISRASCETGAIASVADLRGKRISVNARGATEYWLNAALSTGDLTISDVVVETIPFADAVLALEAGAIDAAMIGEPLATRAIQGGIAVPLADDFPIANVLPTVVIANSDFANESPELVTGFVIAYLKASRDLSGTGWADPANLAIIEQYTQVPAELAAAAVAPVYLLNGEIDPAALGRLQSFFRARGQLEYPDDIDPATVVDGTFVEAALERIGTAGAE